MVIFFKKIVIAEIFFPIENLTITSTDYNHIIPISYMNRPDRPTCALRLNTEDGRYGRFGRKNSGPDYFDAQHYRPLQSKL